MSDEVLARRAISTAPVAEWSASHRSPFKKRDKLAVVDKIQRPSLVLSSESSTLRWNGLVLLVCILVASSTSVQELLASKLVLAKEAGIWWGAVGVGLMSTISILNALWSIFRRSASIDEPESLPILNPDDINKAAEALMRPPRSLFRQRDILSSSPHTPNSLQSATPGRKSIIASSSYTTPFKTPVSVASASSPAFASLYGTPQSNRPVNPKTFIESASRKAVGTEYRSALSSPLPDTGSPRINRVAADQLPSWTEQLRQVLSN